MSGNKINNPFVFNKSHYARNLINEFLWIIKSKSPKRFLKWFFSLKESFKKNHIIEDSILKDVFFRISYISDVFKNLMTQKLFSIKRKLVVPKIPVVSKKELTKSNRIGFICKGNINRSAFAEFYLNKKYPGYSIRSYGTIFKEKRLSPVNAVKAAEKTGIDLNIHRSKYLSDVNIKETDVFIIMDDTNYWDLIKRNVDRNKIFRLNAKNVSDPYGFKGDYFETIFKMISKSLDDVLTEKS
jgi:protein-tyrosine-phosphatase